MPVSLHQSIVGDGLPLIVMHGLFGSGTNWRSFARALSDKWQVHLLDLRNHGQTAHAESMTYPEMANDVAAYMDASGLQSAVILGHSMGGKVAMRFALEWPERTDRLVVADIAPTHSDHDHLPIIAAMEDLQLDRIERRDQAFQALAGAIPDPGLRQFLLQNLVADSGAFRWRINLDAVKSNLPALHGFPLDDINQKFSGPALFIRGQFSDYVPESTIPVIRTLFLQASIVTIENAGHWIHAERPAEFLNAVKSFLTNGE